MVRLGSSARGSDSAEIENWVLKAGHCTKPLSFLAVMSLSIEVTLVENSGESGCITGEE